MDNPQYKIGGLLWEKKELSFKPYYKWITLNTEEKKDEEDETNLGFKPYYKWITLNTQKYYNFLDLDKSLSFKPYYKWITLNTLHIIMEKMILMIVLNLIING